MRKYGFAALGLDHFGVCFVRVRLASTSSAGCEEFFLYDVTPFHLELRKGLLLRPQNPGGTPNGSEDP